MCVALKVWTYEEKYDGKGAHGGLSMERSPETVKLAGLGESSIVGPANRHILTF